MTKLNAYGFFTVSALRLIYDYFSNRKQKKNKKKHTIGNSYSSRFETILGAP